MIARVLRATRTARERFRGQGDVVVVRDEPGSRGAQAASERAVEEAAEVIEAETVLSAREAFVLAADNGGWSTRRIGRYVGRSNSAIERSRRRIREYKREYGDSHGEIERTRQLLEHAG